MLAKTAHDDRKTGRTKAGHDALPSHVFEKGQKAFPVNPADGTGIMEKTHHMGKGRREIRHGPMVAEKQGFPLF
jgi:hypothetical protein